MVVIVGESEIADEMRVTSETFDRFSKLFNTSRFIVEFPDQDGSISWGSDKNLSIFVLSLGVSSLNSCDPVSVSFKMSNFGDGNFTFDFSHQIFMDLINLLKY